MGFLWELQEITHEKTKSMVSGTEQAPNKYLLNLISNYIFRNTKPFLRKILSSFLKRKVVLVYVLIRICEH